MALKKNEESKELPGALPESKDPAAKWEDKAPEAPKVEPEAPQVEPKAEDPKPKKAKKLWYVAKIRLWHPFQNKHVDSVPVALELDAWLQSQIDAGIVTQVEVED